MPRKPRYFLPGICCHLVQRGGDHEAVFSDAADHAYYLECLAEAAARYGCAIHAYVLMIDHVHLLLTPKDKPGVSRMMQYVGRYYVPYVNDKYGSSGTLWQGRFKASLVDDAKLLTCMRYIDTNPVRSGVSRAAAYYRWSSYRANAQARPDALLTPHELYLGLGRNKRARADSYKELCKQPLDAADLRDIREAWQSGTPLGDAQFKKRIERRLKCKVGHARRGRPRKTPLA